MKKNNLPDCIKTAISTFEKDNFPLRAWQHDAMHKIAKMQDGDTMLCDATCGAGKSTVQALHIASEMNRLENEGKHGIFLIASPRLFLNEQLYAGIEKKIPDFSKRCRVYNFSSGEIAVLDGETTVSASSFKDALFSGAGRDCFQEILKTRHILLVACFNSLNDDLDESRRAIKTESLLNRLFSALSAADGRVFDVVVIDECHKGFKASTFEKLKSNARHLTLYSATPTKRIECKCNARISYGFQAALRDSVVVKPWLYSVSQAAAISDSKINAAIKCSTIVSAATHMIDASEIGKRKVLCVFDNTVDNLNDYRNTIEERFGDKFDIAVYASDKDVVVKNSLDKAVACKHVGLNFNGEAVKDKKTLRELQEKSKKPLIILSAYMLQEGIDMPYINGVLVLGEKTDTNLYQAVCRGDRKNRDDRTKTHFNVYIPSYLNNSTNDFLSKLVDGFENELDFGCGEEKPCGQNQKCDADDTAMLPEVVPMALRDKKMVVELVNAYNEEHRIENAWKQMFADAKKLLDNGGTRGEAVAMLSGKMGVLNDANMLKNMQTYIDFCNSYKTSSVTKK